MKAMNNQPSIELLSACKVGGIDGYVCARGWPSTTAPELYDVRLLDEKGTILKGLEREKLTHIVPPTEEMRRAVIR